jgi:hypothetical protein
MRVTEVVRIRPIQFVAERKYRQRLFTKRPLRILCVRLFGDVGIKGKITVEVLKFAYLCHAKVCWNAILSGRGSIPASVFVARFAIFVWSTTSDERLVFIAR